MKIRIISLVLLAFAASACVTPNHRTIDVLGASNSGRSILLMPIDVELSELSASGFPVQNAAWTAAAHEHMTASLQSFMSTRSATLTAFIPSEEDETPTSDVSQLQKLHAAVGGSIQVHFQAANFRLPHKNDQFDWTLGPKVSILSSDSDVDYALFIWVRDSYASAGRVAVMAVAAVLGVGLQGGTQNGFATLVDMKSGEIVWFNSLFRGAGDLRTLEAAKATVELLLANFPS